MNRVPRGFWQIKANVMASAKRFSTVSEWAKHESSARTSARKNGWYEEATSHMYEKTKPQGYWKIKANVIKSALACRTITQWGETDRGALYEAKKQGWFDEAIEHMDKTIRPNGYWNNKERVINSAKQFKTITEWTRKYGQAVKQAKKNRWFKEAISHMEETGTLHKRAIYCYMSHRKIYIGLTYNIKNRWNAHKKRNKHYKALSIEYGEESIKFLKLTDYIDIERAKAKEEHFINLFRRRGFTVLNKAQAGATGGNILKWNKNAVLESSRQFQTLHEWVERYNGAVTSARKNGWYEEATSHMSSNREKLGYWLIKDNVINSAHAFCTLKDWTEKSSSAVTQARKNGWFEEATKHMEKKKRSTGYWNIKVNVIASAKKYNHASDWKNSEGAAYNAARINNWFDEASSHMKPKDKVLGKWQIKENVLASAKLYKSVSEWHKNHSGAVSSSRKNGWHEEATAHMATNRAPPGFWQIKENVISSAKELSSLVEWNDLYHAAVSSARKNGWFDEATEHMDKIRPNGFWSKKQNVIDSAKHFYSVVDWSRKHSAAAKAARKYGWIDEVKSLIQKNQL